MTAQLLSGRSSTHRSATFAAEVAKHLPDDYKVGHVEQDGAIQISVFVLRGTFGGSTAFMMTAAIVDDQTFMELTARLRAEKIKASFAHSGAVYGVDLD